MEKYFKVIPEPVYVRFDTTGMTKEEIKSKAGDLAMELGAAQYWKDILSYNEQIVIETTKEEANANGWYIEEAEE